MFWLTGKLGRAWVGAWHGAWWCGDVLWGWEKCTCVHILLLWTKISLNLRLLLLLLSLVCTTARDTSIYPRSQPAFGCQPAFKSNT